MFCPPLHPHIPIPDLHSLLEQWLNSSLRWAPLNSSIGTASRTGSCQRGWLLWYSTVEVNRRLPD